MAINLKGRSFLKLIDYTPEEFTYLINLAKKLKAEKKAGKLHKHHQGKNMVILFQKDSTRTRCSFEIGGMDLGLGVTYLGPQGSQMGKKESIEDTAKVLGRMYDCIEFRGYKQTDVEMLAKHSGVPVYNGLTDMWHPTQILADFLTIEEVKGKVKGLNFTYFGDAKNNMGNSLMIGAAMMGMNYTACAPKSLWPSDEVVKIAKDLASKSGAKITLTDSVEEGAKDADVIYTDVWVSMGESNSVWEKRIKLLKPYQVNNKVMNYAKKDAMFLHCLPAFHDHETDVGAEIGKKFKLDAMEVTDEVFRAKQSYVFQEAENRMHTIKAVIYATLGVKN